MPYSIRLYTSIAAFRFFALSNLVLFILMIQSVNDTQFLNVTCLFILSAFLSAGSAPVPVIDIVLFTSMCTSLYSQRLDLNIVVSNLNWLLVLYVPRSSTFTSIQFFALNFDGWSFVWFSKYMILWHSILSLYVYDYSNPSLSIIFYRHYGRMCLSIDIFSTVNFFGSSRLRFVIVFAISFPTRSPAAASAIFGIVLVDAVLSASVDNFIVASRSFCPYLLLKLLLLLQKFFSRGMEFWSVNHVSIYVTLNKMFLC